MSELDAPARRPWVVPLAMLALSLAACILLWMTLGTTLGTFYGGIVLAALLAPYGAVAAVDWKEAGISLVAVLAPVVALWLLAALGPVTAGGWLRAVAVLAAWVLALAGLALLLRAIRVPAEASAAIVVILALAWLSWPVWLAPWLRSADLAAALVAAHPPLVLNGVLRDAYPFPWAQHALAYPLTNLGDDIPYSLPSGIAPAFFVHMLLALPAAAIVCRRRCAAAGRLMATTTPLQ